MTYEEYDYAKYHLLCYTIVPSQSYEKHYNIISVLIQVLIFERLDLGFKFYVKFQNGLSQTFCRISCILHCLCLKHYHISYMNDTLNIYCHRISVVYSV